MWRTVFISTGQKLSVRNGNLLLKGDEEVIIPAEDIYTVVIESGRAVMTVPALNMLTSAGAHVILCDERHMPSSVILPLNMHYRPYSVLKMQIGASEEFKDLVWQDIVMAKILNQARVLQLSHVPKNHVENVKRYAKEVTLGDMTNREGLAAKIYFRYLFGSEFLRFSDDGLNYALNYGYSIIRSSISKHLAAYGFNCCLGIHHISEQNAFNLTDDLMEPFRPVVDLWVNNNHTEIVDELTRAQRISLIGLVNQEIMFNGRKMKIRNVMDLYIKNFTTSIMDDNPARMKYPEMLRTR